MNQQEKVKPSVVESCLFEDMWLYKRRENEVIVLEVDIPLLEIALPMQAVDFTFTGATSDTHHTFVGKVLHETGFYMN